MKLAKILGSIIGAILYPLFCISEWVLALVVVIFETIEKLSEDDRWEN